MLWKRRWIVLFTLLLVLPFSLGVDCGGEPNQPAQQLLYVLDQPNDAVYVLPGINTIDGNQDPDRTIQGDNTRLSNPTAIAVDGLRDILYVSDANEGRVLVFAPASTQDGDVVPARTLPTGEDLGNLQSLTLDEVGNRLYVFNATILSIQVWDDVSTVDDEPPDRTFGLGFLASAIFIDASRDLLYVGDPIDMVIKVYAEASTLIGDPFPSAILKNIETPFDRINSLAMNQDNDILYVANSLTPAVEVFDNASTLNEDVVPDRDLEGDNTELTDKMRFIKFLQNVLYVNNNSTQIGVWDNANQLDGDVSPNRLITVNGATQIVGFDIDLLH